MDTKTLGQINYEAYMDSAQESDEWPKLDSYVKDTWERAAQAVASDYASLIAWLTENYKLVSPDGTAITPRDMILEITQAVQFCRR